MRQAGGLALMLPQALAVALVAAAHPAAAATLIGVEEAMALAFPGAAIERDTIFLTEEARAAAEAAAGTSIAGAMVTRFVARWGSELIGYGYLDTHRVRTLPESLLVMIDAAGAVVRVEVVAFREPLEYLPPGGWYRQFDGETLREDLALKRAIRPITGATLTARSATDAVRRVLAIHRSVTGGAGPR